ncbi:hypothetical protein AVEN_194248-1 [Araneus ventricosus]|uniref:Uncharacterized protein n=1 Tax=Araneus ventricosus TaxID=182803 RepID=A0A4Y2GEY5_ARAVE|nr:hypothetical protein AVEN_194248-1 [Araneus ventricosus]
MEESEHDVGSLEKLELYADEHYLARKLPLEDHLGKVPRGAEEYHQDNAGPLRFHVPQLEWTDLHRLWPPEHYACCAGSVSRDNVGGIVPFTRAPPQPYAVIICPQNESGFITKHHVCQSVAFHVALTWHCRRSRQCFGVKGSTRTGRLD